MRRLFVFRPQGLGNPLQRLLPLLVQSAQALLQPVHLPLLTEQHFVQLADELLLVGEQLFELRHPGNQIAWLRYRIHRPIHPFFDLGANRPS